MTDVRILISAADGATEIQEGATERMNWVGMTREEIGHQVTRPFALAVYRALQAVSGRVETFQAALAAEAGSPLDPHSLWEQGFNAAVAEQNHQKLDAGWAFTRSNPYPEVRR